MARSEKKPKYYLKRDGEFTIENYSFSKPLANFFPGIAGKYGIPMWVFYVNRGQGIISMGTADKDHSILEFFPANKAWYLVTLKGFRTFIKISGGKKTGFYEPFHYGLSNLGFNLSSRMSNTASELKIEETNSTLGIKVNVEYFTIPNESYAALARVLTIKNTSRKKKSMQVLDGVPHITPYGTSNLFLKKLSRTIEAWMDVENLKNKAAFFKLDVDPTDRPEVIHIREGNFYLGFYYDSKGLPQITRPIVDPQGIFGPVTDFSSPYQFLKARNFIYPENQNFSSKMPCAFSLFNLQLSAGEEKTFYFLLGHMKSLGALNSSLKKITASGYLLQKKEENKRIIRELQQDIHTESAKAEFNLYAENTYLDNIMRGGYPVIFGKGRDKKVFYLYSRKHGDLERDYNKFHLEPAFFSQGNGNYRDINQNRRCDIWFRPEIEEENLVHFFNLLQTDGFNPLVVKGASFNLKENAELKKIFQDVTSAESAQALAAFLQKPFTPGDVIFFLKEHKIKLKTTYDDFLNALLPRCIQAEEAEHGEGFWTDHWAYNLDLLKNYLCVWPEKLQEILFEKKCFTYYDNIETVRPRSEKYWLYHGLPRQLHSVYADNAKKEMIRKRTSLAHTVRAMHGQGEIYKTTLINKLLCLIANKMSSLDPFGIGIEMEANKPNWYDALNGLPALFGSSLCETLELKRLILFIKDSLNKSGIEKINVTEEVCRFLIELDRLARENLNSATAEQDYQYWDKSYSLKEDYRQKTIFGFDGNETEMQKSGLSDILDNFLAKLNSGIDKALDKKKSIYYSYFINEVTEYETIKDSFIRPKRFKQKKLPFFLEGQVHALRLAEKNEAKKIHQATRKSELYDKELKMYRVTASLDGMPEEIGRCRIFAPGWLERESIWLHMEYKYLLELLKTGLYDEFYADFKNVFIPFQDPQKYGRSILENSSFLVSSAFPDKKLHGNGFVARLSGSTAEFINIWLVMNLGIEPFFLNEHKELNLKFAPILAGWLFRKKEKTYSFNFLGKISVTYHNPKMKNTFGSKSVKPKKIIFIDRDNKPVVINSDTLPHPYAEQIRERQINRIDIYLD